MLHEPPCERRECRTIRIDADLVTVGGGLAGVCCAITAARAGIKVALIQDRPVLGGNASSEVRLWILGATSHMGNNNRWAREGGVVDEILVENMYRNPEGNPVIFDTVLLEKVSREPNIRLLLNTSVHEVRKTSADQIESVRAFCSQNSTVYDVHAPLFCDSSGDGIVGFLAGAAFRMGAEAPEEFGERFAPSKEYGSLLGDSIYFYSKDVGRPVQFVAPSFALQDIRQIPHYRRFNTREHGCQLWWIELGGHLDTVHDSELIKWELWKVVYGVWHHIKNSGRFPEAETLTLEWVGTIPGKRESRRFEGDYMLVQQDIVEQRRHSDAVSYGGWSIDLHPAEGVYGDAPPCDQWHAKGLYQIPYRCLYSRNIGNLFLAGRLISASHVAFGSSRVMATCAHNAQAVGMAAVLCTRDGLSPRDLTDPATMRRLQLELIRTGQYIPGVLVDDEQDLARLATVTASSSLRLSELRPGADSIVLDAPRAMLVPMEAGAMPEISFWLEATEPTQLEVQLRVCSRHGSFTPDITLETQHIELAGGSRRSLMPVRAAAEAAATHDGHGSLGVTSADGRGIALSGGAHGAGLRSLVKGPLAGDRLDNGPETLQPRDELVTVRFESTVEQAQYVFICLMTNPAVRVRLSDQRVSGILSVAHQFNTAVARSCRQEPPAEIGVDAFEFWLPARRPKGKNFAMRVQPALRCFGPENATRGPARPTGRPNAWVASPSDTSASLTFSWAEPQVVRRVELTFDTDLDHPMESVLMGHPERVMPFCVKHYRLRDGQGRLLCEVTDNHQTRNVLRLPRPTTLDRLTVEVVETHGAPAAIFSVRCYGEL